jgi:hypothetical protein
MDFATTLHDGRCVLERLTGGRWPLDVYTAGEHTRLIGYGIASTRPCQGRSKTTPVTPVEN